MNKILDRMTYDAYKEWKLRKILITKLFEPIILLIYRKKTE